MPDQHFDLIIVGGGIVGLSTAMHLTRTLPKLRLLVLEKEGRVGSHQSGHNSGVIHSGIYYKPGSLKAKLCVEGAAAMLAFCREHNLPCKVTGKVIVATNDSEIPRLQSLRERGQANGLAGVRMLQPEELRDLEPHCGGIAWLLVPSTGITDYQRVCEKYSELVTAQGGEVRTAAEVTGIVRSSAECILETAQSEFRARFLINCAGLHSDRISRMANQDPAVQIVPFRGEYYDLVPGREHLVRSLIYPVPDPQFPFLGVHFTRRVAGGVDAGPNAVLAFKREGYRRTDFSLRDTAATFSYPGFWRLAARHWRNAAAEFHRSFSKPAFVHSLQTLVPEIQPADLVADGSGVRAQALRSDGSLVDDFQFARSDNVIHVLNVPSPAATASLPIGREIAHLALEGFGLQSR